MATGEGAVSSRWVKEESNAATLRKISKKIKVISALIEKCKIPDPVAHLKHADFCPNYFDGLHEILEAIIHSVTALALSRTTDQGVSGQPRAVFACGRYRSDAIWATMQLHDAQGKRLYLTADERVAFLAAAAKAARPVRTFCGVLPHHRLPGLRGTHALADAASTVDRDRLRLAPFIGGCLRA